MQKKRRLISIGLSMILVLLAALLFIFTFRTINRVFFDAVSYTHLDVYKRQEI